MPEHPRCDSPPESAPESPPDSPDLLLRLLGGDPAAEQDLVRSARSGPADVPVLVAAGVLSADTHLLDSALLAATHPRDRQLVALGQALLSGDADLFDALVRDHLSTYPDQLLAAWLAARTR
jgi:hypothetical protein